MEGPPVNGRTILVFFPSHPLFFFLYPYLFFFFVLGSDFFFFFAFFFLSHLPVSFDELPLLWYNYPSIRWSWYGKRSHSALPLCVFPNFISCWQDSWPLCVNRTKLFNPLIFIFFSLLHCSHPVCPFRPIVSSIELSYFSLPFCCFCHLPTQTRKPMSALTSHSSLYLTDHFTWAIYFWDTMCLMTWRLCHSFSFAQWPSSVLAAHVEWMTKPCSITYVEPVFHFFQWGHIVQDCLALLLSLRSQL